MNIRSFLAAAVCLFLITASTHYAQTGSALTVSEVMFYPSETNGEFIEIYNTSTTETVDLSSIKFKYSTASNNSFVAFQGGTTLAPGKYAVVLQGNYDYNNGAYKYLIPAGTVILKLATNSFGSSGMANTTSRDVFLINSSGITIDTYSYSADNNAGISDEKFLMIKDNSTSNWRNSIKANGTPGYRNSVTPVKYLNDLSIRIAGLTPANPVEGDSVQVNFIIKNTGVYDASAFGSELFIDQNADSIGQANESIYTKSYSELFVSDSVFVTSKFFADKTGKMLIIANANYSIDENPVDNKVIVSVNVAEKPVQYSEVVVNEILYAPINEEPEWIELYNKSDRQINLKNWKISDNTSITTITTSDYLLNPGEYVVVSGDATIGNFYPYVIKSIVKILPSLGNSGDVVILKSSSNTTIDSVKYSPTWGGNIGGYSLERISVTNNSNDPLNWKTATSKYRATPSNINSVTQKNNDLQLTSFFTTVSYAEIGKSIQFTSVIANLGKNTVPNYTVSLFRDKNSDGIEDENEKIAELAGSNLNSNSTASFSFSTSNFVAGQNQFIVRVNLESDEFNENNTSLLKIAGVVLNEVKGDLVINEIMYKPVTSESDWIEIYNKSHKSINLRGYQIGNGISKNIVLSKDFLLNPSEHFVIIRDSSKFTGFAKPAKWIMASFPTLTDTKSKIVISDSLNRSIDSLEYKSTWGGSSGKSLEKIDPEKLSTDSTNWKTTTSKYGGTPGKINSISQKNYDLYVKSFSFAAPYAEVGKTISLTAVVTNNGKALAQYFSVKLFRDINLNGIEETNEFVSEQLGIGLSEGASSTFNFSFNNIQSGQNQFIVRVEYTSDEYVENNSSILKVNGVIINETKGDLIINEIMYSSRYVSQQWIEIFNKSQKVINLNGYQILSGTKKTKIISKNISINPGNYFVVARDSSVFNFNPQLSTAVITEFTSLSGKVAILDSLNRTIDSLEYKSAWGGTGWKSLERIDASKTSTDSTNWHTATSKFGGTPGAINSVTQKNYDLYIKTISTPVPYAEIGKNFPLTAVITNNGKSLVQYFSVKLFRDANFNGIEENSEQIAELPGTNLNAGNSASFNFSINNFVNGQNQFIVRVDYSSDEFPENNSGSIKINGFVLNEVRGDIIVNEFMYTPASSEPEWIELYNRSQKQISLKGYQIGNATEKSRIISSEVLLNPNEYFVFTHDTLFVSKYPQVKKWILATFPALPNTKGRVVILDSLNRTIDSLEYKSTWGGGIGKSLERIDPAKSSIDSTNWKTSTSKFLGTPGGINSITPKNYDMYVKSISASVPYIEVGKGFSVVAEITNNGKSVVNNFSVKLFRDANFNGIEEVSEQISELPGTNLAPNATVSFSFYTNNFITGQNQFIIRVDNLEDEYEENNSALLKVNGIIINEVKGDLVINEIMYSSKYVSQQWLEIYNRSQKVINLNGYQVLSDSRKNKVISTDILLNPDNYIVIARDSSVFNFNPKSSAVVISEFTSFSGKVEILDSLNRAIDSLEYKSGWGGTGGKSLERIDASKSSTDSTNWKTATSKLGGTPGAINSVTQKNYDLYVKSISTTVPYAEIGKNFPLIAVITNNGRTPVQNYLVKLFRDANLNGVEELSEQIAEFPGTDLNPGTSASFNFSTNNFQSGQNQFIVRIDFSNDEFIENNYGYLKVNGYVLNELRNDIVINEIMYAPASSEPEWIEIYNQSPKQINLNGYQIGNGTIKNKIISKEVILKPSEYFVITHDTSLVSKYPTIKKWIMTIFPDLPNTKGRIVLLDSLNRTIDSLEYKNNWGGSLGKSLERVDLAKSSIDSTNWKTSTSKYGGTPGTINSVTEKNHDLYVKSFSQSASYAEVGKSVPLTAIITNNGKNVAKSFSVKLFRDFNFNGIEESNELISELSGSNLDLAASTTLNFSVSNIQAGQNQFIVRVDYIEDEYLENNSFSLKVNGVIINEEKGDLIINEIMYSSRYVSQQWLEIYNKSQKVINLKGYQILSGSKKNKVISKNISISPDNYLVIARDSSVFNFNTKLTTAVISEFTSFSGKIGLLDSLNRTIDSLEYKSGWGGTAGKSLERIDVSRPSTDSTNWNTANCKSGGTPGSINSLSSKNYDLFVKSISTTVPYAEIGKNVSLIAVVTNNGKSLAQNFTVKLFRDANHNDVEEVSEQIAELPGTNLNPGASTSFNFSTNNFVAGQNQFIIRVDFNSDEFTENNSSSIKLGAYAINEVRGDIVINELMYTPANSDPEWIELYNQSSKQISLNGYQVGIGSGKNKIVSKEILLNPNEYFVITHDTSIVARYPLVKKFTLASLPDLPNTKGKIVILDSLNRTIDSLEYKNTWGGSVGKSLERIDPAKLSKDSTNWKTSASKFGATPGGINSVTQKNYDLYVKSISTIVPYAEIGKNIPITAVISNNGKLSAANYSVKLFRDANLNGLEEANEKISEFSGSNLAANATTSYNFSTNNFVEGQNQFIVRVDFSGDEFTENNNSVLKVNGIVLNELKGDLVINEILYSAKSVLQQWIEIYNKSQKIINLKGYQIFSNGKKNKVIPGDALVKPGNYYVIARDTSVFGYNSKLTAVSISDFTTLAGKVALLDSLNRTIDSLEYKSSWGGSVGKSLERIDPAKASTDSTNWKTATSKYGGTPGSINSAAQKDYDLSVKNFSLASSYAEAGKKNELIVVVTNNGKLATQSFTIKVINDLNLNGVEEPGELISTLPGSNLSSGASAGFSLLVNNLPVGTNQFIARVEFAGDEFYENNSALLKVTGVVINEVKGDLLINELMYSTKYVSQQWLEIYNNSKKIINLNGYQFLSGTKKNRVVTQNISVNPDGYIVIARDSSVFNFNPKLTAAIISEFTSFSGKVAILDSLNRTIDSLEYKNSWGSAAGKSLERIEASKSSTDSTNWSPTVNLLGATPGLVNSLSKKNYDVVVNKISFNPNSPSIGQKVKVRVEISNIGRTDASFNLVLYLVNKEGNKIKVEETNLLSLSKSASLSYEFSYAVENLVAKTTFECTTNFLLDEDLSNNTILGFVSPGYLAGSVLINEVMYNPLNGEPEWIEFYNNSTYDIDLEDWTIGDVLTSPQKATLKAKDYLFSKKGYLVVAKDSTIKNYHNSIPSRLIVSNFPSLNNDADGVVMKDAHGSTIDSVLFDAKWGGENGKSIERKQFSTSTLDKSNWASSKDVELGTPGRLNSVAIKKNDIVIRAIIPIPLYPILNEDVSIGAKIYNNGTAGASNFSVKFYSKENNLFTQLTDVSISNVNSHDSLIVFSDKKIKLTGIKTFMCKVIYTTDEDTLNNFITADVIPGTKPNSVLITEIMYAPLTGEPEWIEFVNVSNESINLKNWSVSDLLPSPTKAILTSKDEFIQPGEYAVVTPDTNAYAFIPPKKFYLAKFGSLGNTTDGITLCDFRNAVIDSIKYSSAWGGGNGCSLERISLLKATNDSTNWITSLSRNGASAGLKNSVANAVKYSRNSLVINEILYEPETGKAEFLELYNPTIDTVQVGGMEVRIGDKSKTKLAFHSFSVPPKQYFVTASDSSIYQSFPLLRNSKQVSVSPSLILPNDGTILMIKDLYGTTLDSLAYSSAWHNRNLIVTKNKSLERINPLLSANDHSNWSTSVAGEGSTPAKANSIYTENLSHDSKVNISPNPFSPDNDGYEDFAIINFELPYKLSQVRIKVFDSKGRLVRTLLENRPSGASNSVIFNGFDDEGRSLRIGIYILLIEISAEGSSNIETIKTPIVIARKLN